MPASPNSTGRQSAWTGPPPERRSCGAIWGRRRPQARSDEDAGWGHGATEDEEAGKKRKKKPWRYRFPDDVRDDVLARLIALNRERAEDERRRGLTVTRPPRSDPDESPDPDE